MHNSSYFPSKEQELLLIAALSDSSPAINAWQRWCSISSIESTDQGSLRLLPLVFNNLLCHGYKDRNLMLPLKVMYNQTRSDNNALFANLVNILEVFDRINVKTLVVKGAALAISIYEDHGARPMADLDIAVSHFDLAKATDALLSNGWSFKPITQHDGLTTLQKHLELDFLTSVTFANSDGTELDLHCSIFHDLTGGYCNRFSWETHEPLWQRAIPLEVNGHQTLTLSLGDQLLHTLAHGSMCNSMPPIRWVADASWIMKRMTRHDWDILNESAKLLRLNCVSFSALQYLNVKFSGGVPQVILNQLKRPPDWIEFLEFQMRHGKLAFLSAFLRLWYSYVILRPNKNYIVLLINFPNYLKYRWSIRKGYDLLRVIIKKLLNGK